MWQRRSQILSYHLVIRLNLYEHPTKTIQETKSSWFAHHRGVRISVSMLRNQETNRTPQIRPIAAARPRTIRRNNYLSQPLFAPQTALPVPVIPRKNQGRGFLLPRLPAASGHYADCVESHKAELSLREFHIESHSFISTNIPSAGLL